MVSGTSVQLPGMTFPGGPTAGKGQREGSSLGLVDPIMCPKERKKEDSEHLLPLMINTAISIKLNQTRAAMTNLPQKKMKQVPGRGPFPKP